MSTSPVPPPGAGTGPPGVPPQKSSNALAWILGFAGVAVVLFVVGGLMIASFFVRSLRIDPRAHQVEVGTRAGKLTVAATEARDLGLPVYPGATMLTPGASLEFTAPEDEKVGFTTVGYHVSDPFEKVDAWYRERLGPAFKRDAGDREGKIRVHGVMTEGVA